LGVEISIAPLFTISGIRCHVLVLSIQNAGFILVLQGPAFLVDVVCNCECLRQGLLHSTIPRVGVVAFLERVINHSSSVNLLIQCWKVLFVGSLVLLLPLLITGIPVAWTSPDSEFRIPTTSYQVFIDHRQPEMPTAFALFARKMD
jgi:hypothetical protein